MIPKDEKVWEFIRSGSLLRERHWLLQGQNADVELVRSVNEVFGYPALIAVIQESVHLRFGTQWRIEKSLSDDLILSDLHHLDFDDIPIPFHSIEFFFEDPELPSALLTRCSADDVQRALRSDMPVLEKDDYLMFSLQELDKATKAPLCLAFNLKRDMWDVVVNTDFTPNIGGTPLDSIENTATKEMLHLCLKICAYAALPQFRFHEVTKITRKEGGKPGFLGRPKRPAQKISYLPVIHSSRERDGSLSNDESPSPERKKRTYRGHRGYFMYFKHPRYKKMRFKRIFVPPDRPDMPDNGKTTKTYLIRKPRV